MFLQVMPQERLATLDLRSDAMGANETEVDLTSEVLKHKGLVILWYRKQSVPSRLAAVYSAEDFWQDIYLRAIQEKFKVPENHPKPEAAVIGWLLQVANNRFRNLLRDHRHEMRLSTGIGSGSSDLVQKVPARHTPPSAKLRRRERIARLHAAIEQLEKGYQVVAKELFLNNRSAEELARLLKVKVNTIYKMSARLKEKLKPYLDPESDKLSG
jgi:RNA polymerase sigma factor (sigma-70 family)